MPFTDLHHVWQVPDVLDPKYIYPRGYLQLESPLGITLLFSTSVLGKAEGVSSGKDYDEIVTCLKRMVGSDIDQHLIAEIQQYLRLNKAGTVFSSLRYNRRQHVSDYRGSCVLVLWNMDGLEQVFRAVHNLVNSIYRFWLLLFVTI